MMTMMMMTVTGSCVSFCMGVSVSGTSVSRVSCVSRLTVLELTSLEFLGERKFGAAGEKKQTNEYAQPRPTRRRGKNRTWRVDAVRA
jgi:hypothetical protein